MNYDNEVAENTPLMQAKEVVRNQFDQARKRLEIAQMEHQAACDKRGRAEHEVEMLEQALRAITADEAKVAMPREMDSEPSVMQGSVYRGQY